MLAHIPSLAALESGGDQLLAELRFARLRSQVAVVRAIADQVEHVTRTGDADGLHDQMTEEMARLGCQLLEAAGLLAGSPRPDESGVFARRGGQSRAHVAPAPVDVLRDSSFDKP